METSQSIENIAKALIKFQGEIEPLELDAEVKVTTKSGGEYKFKYATLRNIIEASRKPLSDNELAIIQTVGEQGAVTTLLIHSSGEWIKDTVLISTAEKSPQAIGSSISYAKRYSMSAILRLVAEQDDDANIAQGNQFEVKETPKETDERPWLSEKAYEKALEKLEYKGEIFVEDAGTLTREGFVKWLKENYRMKRVYKEQLELTSKKAILETEKHGNIKQNNTDSDLPF